MSLRFPEVPDGSPRSHGVAPASRNGSPPREDDTPPRQDGTPPRQDGTLPDRSPRARLARRSVRSWRWLGLALGAGTLALGGAWLQSRTPASDVSAVSAESAPAESAPAERRLLAKGLRAAVVAPHRGAAPGEPSEAEVAAPTPARTAPWVESYLAPPEAAPALDPEGQALWEEVVEADQQTVQPEDLEEAAPPPPVDWTRIPAYRAENIDADGNLN